MPETRDHHHEHGDHHHHHEHHQHDHGSEGGGAVNITWIAAASFRAASLLLAQYRPRLLDVAGQSGPAGTALCVFPEYLCAAFCCELYLKSLKKGLAGHSLEKLFGSLREGTRNSVMEKTIEAGGAGYSREQFQADLAASSRAFENWQSFYEDGSFAAFDITFMTNFLNALQRFSLENHAVGETSPDF